MVSPGPLAELRSRQYSLFESPVASRTQKEQQGEAAQHPQPI